MLTQMKIYNLKKQNPEEDESEVIQVGQSQAEEPIETPVGVASDEPVASRARSQTTASEPIATRTRQALGSSPEMSAFADVKDDKTLNEWLHEIAFVTSTMSDPDKPQSFQEAWWDPDLISREKWRGYSPRAQEDVGHGCVEACEKK